MSTEVQPLIEPPAELVEDVDTKSIRIPVARPPLPDPVPAVLPPDDGPVIPKRPNFFRRHFPIPPVRVRRGA